MNTITILATIPARFSEQARPRRFRSQFEVTSRATWTPQLWIPLRRGLRNILFEAIETNMGMKRDNLECQLSRFSTELSAFEKQLDENGVAATARSRNPKWRNLNARCRQLRSRLIAVAKVEATNTEVAQRKEANSAEPAAAS